LLLSPSLAASVGVSSSVVDVAALFKITSTFSIVPVPNTGSPIESDAFLSSLWDQKAAFPTSPEVLNLLWGIALSGRNAFDNFWSSPAPTTVLILALSA
jgi:hypothetical protein